MLDLLILTLFLLARTFLSIHISTVNGGIVNAIVSRDLPQFVQRVPPSPPRSSASA